MAKPEPGRDPQMAARTQKLNVLFALTSLGLLLTFSLMVWVDYDREWKKYQQGFGALELKVTKEQYDQTSAKVASEKVAIEAELKKGEQEVAGRRAEVAKAEMAVKNAHDVWYAVDQDFRFTKALIDVARYEYEEATLHKSTSAPKKKAELERLEAKWAELRVKRDDAEAGEAAAKVQLAELERTKLDAENEQKEKLGDLVRLQEKLETLKPGFVSVVRNLPVLDLANPSIKVNQIMPANLYDDVIFSPTPKVDRCTTCHLGIDKKGYENAAQPFKTHPDLDLYLRGSHPIDKIGCTVCHQGRGRATGFQTAAHVPSTKESEKAWGKYTKSAEYHTLHYWDNPMMAQGFTESQCLKCHQGVVEVPKAEKLNTGIFLVERYGCFGCHKIRGWENLRKVGPDLSKITSKTTEEFIFRWIKDPHGFRATRMPQVWDVRTPDQETPERKERNNTEANAVVAYIADNSVRATFPEPPKGDLTSGRKLFETVGCLACHRVGDDRRGIEGIEAAAFRTHGPNLDGTGSKVSAGWLYSWIRNPKAVWHETKMPNLRLTEKEAADLTAYLMSLKNDAFMARPRPPLDTKLRDTLLREYLEGQYSVAEAKKRFDALDDQKRTLLLGEKTIGRYGCFGCHTIPGFEKATPVGTELTEEGSKLVERLDFGFVHEIPHTLPGWLEQKLLEPRIFDRDKPTKKPDELLRMPKFHLKPEEAQEIVTAILSFTKEQVPLAAQKQLGADERYVEQGRRLVRTHNCQGCHVVGTGGSIQAVIKDQLESSGGDPLQASALAPPMLYNDKSKIGEGARVHTPWLHSFLKDPSSEIRPWLEIRMPTFDFSEEELNTVTRYFAAQDKVAYPYEPKPTIDASVVAAGKNLFEKWQCVKCHVVAGKLPNQEPANMAPDLANVPRRLRADWLSKWLADPGKILPGTRMPANFPDDPQLNAFPEILGGDQQKQIEAVRAYLLTLGGGGGAAGQ